MSRRIRVCRDQRQQRPSMLSCLPYVSAQELWTYCDPPRRVKWRRCANETCRTGKVRATALLHLRRHDLVNSGASLARVASWPPGARRAGGRRGAWAHSQARSRGLGQPGRAEVNKRTRLDCARRPDQRYAGMCRRSALRNPLHVGRRGPRRCHRAIPGAIGSFRASIDLGQVGVRAKVGCSSVLPPDWLKSSAAHRVISGKRRPR